MPKTKTTYMLNLKKAALPVLLLLLLLRAGITRAQMDNDAIMMGKNAFCGGPMYSYSSWNHYWEGTLKIGRASCRERV